MRRIAVWILCVLSLVTGCASSDAEAVPHVRLGMAPRDVRERFEPGTEGTWQTALGSGDDTVLEWAARDAKAPIAQARFEFHLGMLVAIRAHAAEASARENVSTTKKTVTLRAPAPEGGTNVTVLARDCPTHHDEAERYAARAR
jgi:hypothetical protein